MHRQDINAVIRKRYGSVQAFAGQIGYSVRYVYAVIAGHHVYKLAKRMSEELGIGVEEMFPGKYSLEIAQEAQNAETCA